MATPKQITIRNPSPELASRLKSLAEARGESLNSTILYLLERAVGVDARRAHLEKYMTWSDADLEEFESMLAEQRQIDADLWK